jgi:sporulation protein YlmC with PRC-barrel domain
LSVEGRSRTLKKTLFVLLYIGIFSLSLFSQSAALVLNYFDISDETLRQETEEQIKKQLIDELERQNLEYWDDSYVASAIRSKELSGSQLITQAAALELGKIAEVPVVITVEALDQETFLEFIITTWDVEGQRLISTDRKVSRSSVTRYIMINASINSVVEKLSGEYGIAAIQEDPKVRKITFISNQEGLEIYMPDGEMLGEITHSILNITDREYEIGTKILITKKLKGYRDAEQYIFLDKEKSAVPLSDLKKAQTLALEFNWTYTQMMGLGSGFRYYPIADWMYVSFDSYFYLQRDFSTPMGNDITHSDMRLLAGLYLGFGPESIFRVNVSLGAGLIISYPLSRSDTYVDFYINPVNIALELNFEDWSFYLRPELKITLGIGDNNLHKGGIVLSDYNVPAITLGVLRKW